MNQKDTPGELKLDLGGKGSPRAFLSLDHVDEYGDREERFVADLGTVELGDALAAGRRIVAAWNACDGISVDELTPGRMKTLRRESLRLSIELEAVREQVAVVVEEIESRGLHLARGNGEEHDFIKRLRDVAGIQLLDGKGSQRPVCSACNGRKFGFRWGEWPGYCMTCKGTGYRV